MEPDIIHNEFPELLGEKSNFYEYRKIALRWIQLLSGKEWTDYNAHDPGVTILEALCYTLTEIDYKLDFSIEEILVSSPAGSPFKLKNNAFYLAEDIMASAPVTINDYRRLIIDNVDDVNNAWIIPADGPGSIDKNFEVLLLKKNQVILPEKVIEETANLLDRYKGYGSKPMAIKVVAFEHIALHADIYIDNDLDAENVLAEIFFNLNEKLLNVNPDRQTYLELEEQRMGYTDIFDGPKMDNGFITKENLSESIEDVSLIRIKKIIASTIGVDMIDGLSIVDQDKTLTEGRIDFPIKTNGTHYVPYFSPTNPKNQIHVFKDLKRIEVDNVRIHETIRQKALKTKKQYVHKNQHQSPTFLLSARDRNIDDYYSIRNDFPGLYGLKEKGFSLMQNRKESSNDQLKAYLLPFEKLLQNTLARLAFVRDLFSVRQADYRNFNHLIFDISIKENGRESFYNLTRRDQYLTHLLARFDVYFNDNFEMYIADDALLHLRKVITSKEKMLQEIHKISYDRPVYDHSDNEIISSVEKELYLRLSITEPPKRPLHQTVTELKYMVTEVDHSEIAQIDDADNQHIATFMKSFNYGNENMGYHTKQKDPLAALIKAGISKASYKIIESTDKTKCYTVLSDGRDTGGTLISTKTSKKEAEDQVSGLIEKFRVLSQSAEGFYMVDHSQFGNLRNDDFTHFRMSFVFPSWTARFQNRAFRKQVENVVIKLVPAHICVDCLWLDLKEMTAFENIHAEWQQAHKAAKHQKETSVQENLDGLSYRLAAFLITRKPKQGNE